MGELTRIEKIRLERVFEMGDGYVLDFSNRTFEDFFIESLGIEIYDDKYLNEYSGSKANRLREFWKKENNFLVGKCIIDLLEYRKAVDSRRIHNDESVTEEDVEACYKIGIRLRDEIGVAEVDAIQPIEDTRDYKLLADSIKDYIRKNQPEAGLDRLHTYIFRYIRTLCDRHGIEHEKKESLNAIFGKYVKWLEKVDKIDSEITVKILKYSISILDAFNHVRNNRSFAHANESIITYSESILIFNNINSLIKFIQELEGEFGEYENVDDPPEDFEDDGLPF